MATGKVINKTRVYFGPSTSYPSDNSYAGPNDTVTILWAEGTWYYIEYPAGNKRKRMYIKNSSVSQKNGTIPTYNVDKQTRYCMHETDTYFGPSSSKYPKVSTILPRYKVYYLNSKKVNNYALIEYFDGEERKRAWINASKLVTEKPSLVIGERPSDMNIDGSSYMSDKNFYYTSSHNLVGQCTWFCWGRAYEKTGISLDFGGKPNHGKDWYSNVTNAKKIAASSGPVSNSICSVTYGNLYGHVIFIELVDGNIVYYTEANYPNDNRLSSDDGIIKACYKNNFPQDGTAVGYIDLRK